MTAATATLTHESNINGWTLKFDGDDQTISWGEMGGKYDELLDYLIEWSDTFADEDGYTGLLIDDIPPSVRLTVVDMLETIDGSVIVKYEIDDITS